MKSMVLLLAALLSAPRGAAALGTSQGYIPDPHYISQPFAVNQRINAGTGTTAILLDNTGSAAQTLIDSYVGTVINTHELFAAYTDASSNGFMSINGVGGVATDAAIQFENNQALGGNLGISGTAGHFLSDSAALDINFTNAQASTGTKGIRFGFDLSQAGVKTTMFGLLGSGSTNQFVFRPLVDSTTVWALYKADGSTYVLDADTTNGRIGVNKNNPATALDVTGGITSSVANTINAAANTGLNIPLASSATGSGVTYNGTLLSLRSSGGFFEVSSDLNSGTQTGIFIFGKNSTNYGVISFNGTGGAIWLDSFSSSFPWIMTKEVDFAVTPAFANGVKNVPGTNPQILYQPKVNQTTAFQWANAAGTAISSIDTTNAQFRFGDGNPPGALFDLVGKYQVNSSGLVIRDNNVTTVGMGHGIIVARGRQTSQTGAVASSSTFTPLVNGQYVVWALVDMNSWTTPASINVQFSYQNAGGFAKTDTFSVSKSAGPFATAITATGQWHCVAMPLYSNNTAITILTSGTFTGSPSYDISSWIEWVDN